MNFNLREYDDFRNEVEGWCLAKWPESNGFGPPIRTGDRAMADTVEETRRTQRELGERGWLCGHWPVEY
ncbi:MAG: hypothetical protein NZ518_03265, partial [Dehalococcoidia bacterium]|nr:hypothetical protein [Dehalococcoidia bacterium]